MIIEQVEEEVARLKRSWKPARSHDDLVERFLGTEAEALDRFDRVQLQEVLAICLDSRSLSEAGRALFAASRKRRKTVNDADRVRKYLAKYGLSWAVLSAG